MAPIIKKPLASSTGKSGAGTVAKSGKTGNTFGSAGKGGNVFGSTTKSSKSGSGSGFAAIGKSSSTFGSSAKSGSTFISTPKSSSTFAAGAKSSSSPISKTPSFMPLGSTGKPSSYSSNDKKPTLPLAFGGKTTSIYASSQSKSYPSTSFSNPKKSKTSFGILWIPGRKRNKKKNYVHVSHRDDGYKERSPSHNYMSGDSSNQAIKKKEEESNLLVLDRPKGPIATAASAGTVALVVDDKTPQVQESADTMKPEEKAENPDYGKYIKEETKEAAGDANFIEDKDDKSFLENDNKHSQFPDKNAKDRGDKVDSVYLRPPPSHKVRSNTSTTEDEGCGIKCLYYTLQCCDCVLM